MTRAPFLILGAGLLALACGGCEHARAPAAETAASVAPPASAPSTPASTATESPAASAATTATTAQPSDQPATAPSAEASVPSDPSQVRRIPIDEANSLREQGRAILVDVRDGGSYELGHIAGAINIPLQSLPQELDKLPRDKPIITYCA